MSTELNIQAELAKCDSGKYFVPFSKIMELSQSELESIEETFKQFFAANPDYEFTTWRDDINWGTVIRWRKIT